MLETKFLSAGSCHEEALKYACELTASIFLKNINFPDVKYIDIRCESAKEAEELNELLWIYPKDVLIPHNLTHKNDKSNFVEIGYPGSAFNTIDNKLLLNLNPDLPNQTSEYLFYYQLVIEDNSSLRERAAVTWKECKSMGLNPIFLKSKKNEKSF
tara:strand:+ start:747 stop:1214 length:468 start_codon:yes stop_codon:yes gene_type:complete